MPSRFTREIDDLLDDTIAIGIVELKNGLFRSDNSSHFLTELIPLECTKTCPINDSVLKSLHSFAELNPIYFKSEESSFSNVPCRVYRGDINHYWLSSKKYDTSYQPFYPTWILSAFALVERAKAIGFDQIIDVGSGDGRIAYCGRLLGLDSYGIEIDTELVRLQESISSATGVSYHAIEADATRFAFGSIELSRPIFFISGLPELGEMLADSVIRQVMSINALKQRTGFNFMGTHTMKAFSRDHTGWGWGAMMARYNLQPVCALTLPAHWTTEQPIDAAYVYARCT